MSKVLTTAIALLCALAFTANAQERYLVSMTGEAIPIQKGETAVKAAARAGILTKAQSECPTSVVVGSNEPGTVNFGFNAGDVYMQRLVTPVAGTIDTIFWWSQGLVDPPDSSCSVRIFKSNITGENPGPAWVGRAQHWGYYNYAADPYVRKTAAYIDEPGLTPAEQVWVPGALEGTFDPNGEELWGLGGLVTTWHTGQTINAVATADLGAPEVQAGDAFNVCIRVPSADAAGGRTEANMASWSSGTVAPGFFKFYYFPRSSEGSQGWWQREYLANIWVVVTAQGNLPPIIESVTELVNTTLTDPQDVVATVFDCNAEDPADTAVVSVSLKYSVDGADFASVAMTLGAAGWSGQIPGQAPGSTVDYYVEAVDNKGASSVSGTASYTIFNLNRAGYQTTYPTYSYVDMSGVTAILANTFFDPEGSENFDDGTSGPYDMGGDFTFFGTPYRYAWIGANGAVGFSATEAETVNVNVGGFAASLFPPDSDAPVPAAFGWWNDWAPYGSGTGDIKQKAEGTQYIVEWNAVGNFVGGGTSTFQMVFDRSDNSITVNFKEIGTDQMEIQGMTGLQADDTENWLVVNFEGAPVETVPANEKAIKMAYFGTDVQPGEAMPLVYRLNQNYPNPFNPSTKISYSIAQSGFVTLKVYDVLGRELVTLVNDVQEAGSHTVNFDASTLSNGAYFYKLTAGSFSQVKSMLLLK